MCRVSEGCVFRDALKNLRHRRWGPDLLPAFPLFFITLFYFLDFGATEVATLELHVATQESVDGISHWIIEGMITIDDATDDGSQPLIVWDKDYDLVRLAVEEKDLEGFLVFPADFSQSFFMGERTQL